MKVSSLEAVVRALNAAHVPFVVVGGLAVNAHGYGRYTGDVDLVIKLQPDIIKRAFSALSDLGYRPRVPITASDFADEQQRLTWISTKGMAVLNFHSDRYRDTPVDVFVTEPFHFEDEYERALLEEIAPDAQVRIVRLSTLARMKRQAGRMQDLADLEELGLLHGKLDDV